VDLTGQVRILHAPGQAYPWSIGNGGFTNVFKGEYRKTLVAWPTFVAVKILRVSTSDGPQQREVVNRVRRRFVYSLRF